MKIIVVFLLLIDFIFAVDTYTNYIVTYATANTFSFSNIILFTIWLFGLFIIFKNKINVIKKFYIICAYTVFIIILYSFIR